MAGSTAYVGLYGAPTLQAAFASGLVLLLLLGGLRDSVLYPHKAPGSDASYLAKNTLVPALLWKGAHIAVAALCVWKAVEVLIA